MKTEMKKLLNTLKHDGTIEVARNVFISTRPRLLTAYDEHPLPYGWFFVSTLKTFEGFATLTEAVKKISDETGLNIENYDYSGTTYESDLKAFEKFMQK